MGKIVRKSSGITEEFNAAKIFKVLSMSCAGTSIDPQALYEEIEPHLEDGMTTKDIQTIAIKTAADRITVEEPDFQYVAGRLEIYGLRKAVFGQFEPMPFVDLIHSNILKGVYDKEIDTKYTQFEIESLEQHIKHERDMKLSYAGVMQFKEKYLVKDRSTGEIFESPQHAYMLIGMCLHQEEPVETRLQHVIDFYEAVSLHELSLPTPIMAGVRTPTRQFSSCVKIECDDSLDSISATAKSIVSYISKRAGIGINAGAIRAEGSRIRSGEIKHTGVIPFWKHLQTAVKSCSQGGVRGGAATMNYPIWHLEAEKIIVLKNNKGVEENRIRHLDYMVQIDRLMMERLAQDDYITLFSPHECMGQLYAAYYEDYNTFKTLYEKLEHDPSIRKKRVKASELFSQVLQERIGTGRIYPQFVSNVNEQGPYNEPIRQSNLCVEIALPTYPLETPDEEIALCTLAAYNLGIIKTKHDLERIARIAVRALDNLLDYQDYPVKAAEKAKFRRALGIGVTNYAYFLAKNFVKYSDGSANELTHEWFEAMSFYNIKASMELAKERGANEYHERTRWADGKLPIDWYNKNVDKLVKPEYHMNWEWLRGEVYNHGLRNDTTSALMPCESSSQISNSTNGIEPPRALVSVKQSKDGVFNQVVPEVEMLGDEYETAWVMAGNGMRGYLELVAIMQKWVDQGISANEYHDPRNNEDGKIQIEDTMETLAFCSHYGIKSLYYMNVNDGADGTEIAEEDCDSCKV